MTHHSTAGRVKVAGLQPAQVLAGLVGLVFLALGVLGFVRTGFGDFAGDQHATLLGFALNPLHNVVHLVFGVLGLVMASTSGLARLYGWLLFLGYGLVALWGLALAGVFATNPVSGLGNPLALNTNDNWLHLGLAAVGLLIAVLPARRKLVTEPVVEQPVAERPIDERPVADQRASIRDPQAQMDPTTQEMPTQRSGVHPNDRIESMDPTVQPRPVQPVDPAVEQHRARRGH
ncbi:hypothetical protein F4560_004472 [Saccharothrix ecbatanensis]|jgi:hypothetical protein|uniref:DUF4383 domain-containing protein n=1 Tax=Saccharothrix ecbatanensis TaxID=1105145 RepID=A0A7W9M272_9PSEU|nr:DUF4383 domain-containing protein [Saccharothrix ecbatanensis]MBB5804704.1 hypothetical protein [Saccharothrix ecbatanensis]